MIYSATSVTLTNGATYSVVASHGEYDYDWSEAALLRDGDGNLWYGYASGCSCYDYEDNMNPDNLVAVKSWHEAAELGKTHLSESDAVTFAEKLQKAVQA